MRGTTARRCPRHRGHARLGSRTPPPSPLLPAGHRKPRRPVLPSTRCPRPSPRRPFSAKALIPLRREYAHLRGNCQPAKALNVKLARIRSILPALRCLNSTSTSDKHWHRFHGSVPCTPPSDLLPPSP